MAATDIITPARQTFYEGDTAYKRSVSEALLNKFGSASNYIMERIFVEHTFTMDGYFGNNDYDQGMGGIYRFDRATDLDLYYMSVYFTGTSGTNSLRIQAYNSSGVLKGNIFSSNPSISGSNGTRVIVGQRDLTGTPSNITTNTGGHTVNVGALNITSFDAGDFLTLDCTGNGAQARHLSFTFRGKEL